MLEQTHLKANLKALRKDLRRARRSLDGDNRVRAEASIARRVLGLLLVQRAASVSLFLADDGEPDLAGVFEGLAVIGQSMVLPGLTDSGMDFRPYDLGDELATGRFDIVEPATSERVAPGTIGVALTPFVGFDPDGNRIGRGGGYYDRAFGPSRDALDRPVMLGVGFEAQRVASLPCQPHDVPLDGVVTELGVRWFAPSR